MTRVGGHRPAFVAALDTLARAFSGIRLRGLPLPVLVGGAGVEIETGSAVCTGDFDLLGDAGPEVAEALEEAGFRQEARPGHRLGGWYHPAHCFGVEFVSGAYFDGRGDRARVRLLSLPSGDVPVAAVEDLIADRMGQWEASDRRDTAMLRQATLLLDMAERVDEAYLDRRIREDTVGAATLGTVREAVR